MPLAGLLKPHINELALLEVNLGKCSLTQQGVTRGVSYSFAGRYAWIELL